MVVKESVNIKDPNKFDISREPNRHQAFSTGPHMCLGAPVCQARMAVRVSARYLEEECSGCLYLTCTCEGNCHGTYLMSLPAIEYGI